MRPERYCPRPLERLIKRQKIATMAELKSALGTQVDMTVFRKLKTLSYRTSYSHGGSYYTLDTIPEFDDRGLWSHRGVHFSVHGTLLATLKAFIESSEAGFLVRELESILQVGVKEGLLRLVQQREVAREKVSGRFLYCSANRRRRTQQIRERKIRESQGELPGGVGLGRVVPEEIQAAIILFFSLLDERQRRLYAGIESMKCGHGGDQKIAELLDLSTRTVAKGRQELERRDVEIERVRRAGGGRKAVKKNPRDRREDRRDHEV
jgi:hypothetical protein